MRPIGISEYRRLAHAAADAVVDHVFGLVDEPVFQPMTADERRELLDQPLPETGIAPEVILARFRERIEPHPMGNGHPGFFGWVNSPPSLMGIVGDFLAAAMNPSCAGGDHAAIYLERCCTRWLMELIGFPTAGSFGILVSGASMATLTCLAAARRSAAARDGWNIREEGLAGNRPPLVIYLSGEGHSCIHKAAEMLGLGSRQLRLIAVDNQFKMSVPALRDAIRADRDAGRRPFCVAASAGTVNTGAIDPLNELADLCADEDLWLHVDGAYGAIGILDPEKAPRYQGLDRVDSLAIDPHKWMSVPVECGCALLRDAANLRETFSLVPPYLRTEEGKGFGGLPWFSEYGYAQTRGFRALKLWMVIQHLGRAGLTEVITRHNALARYLESLIAAAPDLEMLAPVELSIVCFRYAPTELLGDDDRLNNLNKAIMEEVQAGGQSFLSGTILGGQFALRACVLHYGSTEDHLHLLIDVVQKAGADLRRQIF